VSEAWVGGRDRAGTVVQKVGRVEIGDECLRWRVVGEDGVEVEAVTRFLAELQAAGRASATLRSYAMDLLRWFRFLKAVGVAWDRATQSEARDFARWMQVAGIPSRAHWRSGDAGRSDASVAVGSATPYSAAARAHSETVLRGFYEFHREAGTGPILNPFPLARSRRGRSGNAHRSPMEPPVKERSGRYRPRLASRIPRSIPDAVFNEIFAELRSSRDRALVAFYVSTGARASELLSVTADGVDPGRQLISVVRKGTGQVQELPASSDAFVWLRLIRSRLRTTFRRAAISRCGGPCAGRRGR